MMSHLLSYSTRQLEVHVVSAAGRQLVEKQYIAAHSSGWRVFKVGRAVVSTRPQEDQETRVNLEVRATTLAGGPLGPLSLHQSTRQPLLVLFNTLASNSTGVLPTTPGKFTLVFIPSSSSLSLSLYI